YAHPAAEPEYEPTIVAVTVVDFNEAQKIGEPFRDGDAVVFEVTDAEFDVANRFIDFAAGLCFCLLGKMLNLTRVMDTDRRVFAIVPECAVIPTVEIEDVAGLR